MSNVRSIIENFASTESFIKNNVEDNSAENVLDKMLLEMETSYFKIPFSVEAVHVMKDDNTYNVSYSDAAKFCEANGYTTIYDGMCAIAEHYDLSIDDMCLFIEEDTGDLSTTVERITDAIDCNMRIFYHDSDFDDSEVSFMQIFGEGCKNDCDEEDDDDIYDMDNDEDEDEDDEEDDRESISEEEPESEGCRSESCKSKKEACKSEGCKSKSEGCKKEACKREGCKESSYFYMTEGCKKEGCKSEGCKSKSEACKKEGCKTEGCKKESCKSEGCKSKTEGCKKEGCKSEGCRKLKKIAKESFSYNVNYVNVYNDGFDYYVELADLEHYMDDNNISSIKEAVWNVATENDIDWKKINILCESRTKLTKKKSRKGKAKTKRKNTRRLAKMVRSGHTKKLRIGWIDTAASNKGIR